MSSLTPTDPVPKPPASQSDPSLASTLLGWAFRYVPALDSLRSYSWRALGDDWMAGLTVATVAVPQAMAYAILAGVAPQYGLYTAIVMTAVGAVLASSPLLINGPTNAISIALLSALAVVPENQRVHAAVLLSFLVGAIQLGIAFLRLGDLTRYVSHSVIVGFTVGAGTLLVLDQMKNFLGLESMGAASDHFLKRFWLTLSGGEIRWPTFLIGAGTILVVLVVRRLNGFLRRRGARFPLPQHLVAVVLMAALVHGLQLDRRFGVAIVGEVPATLPQFAWPELRSEEVRLLSANAFAIAMLGLLEAIAMAKSIAPRTSRPLDINQQCLSEGAANMVGSFFQCIPGSGSLTRSAVNQQSGAVSQWSGVFCALAVAATVVLFAPWARYIPKTSLAGLLMLAAFRMVDRKQLVFHLKATRLDMGVVLVTALAAICISVEFCILIGVFLSFALYLPRAAQVRMVELIHTGDDRIRERRAGDPVCNRLLIYNLEGELFFGAEPDLARHFTAIETAAKPPVRVVLLVLKRARNPDAAFLRLLFEFQTKLRSRGITLILTGVMPDLAAGLSSTKLDEWIDARRILHDHPDRGSSTHDAVLSAYELLGSDLCETCPRR
jgi:SulP family sulfate permease